MSAKTYVVTAVVAGVMFLFAVKMFHAAAPQQPSELTYSHGTSDPSQVALSRLLLQQRNNISRQLNKNQQRIGQLECEKKGENGAATSGTGGWCKKSSTEGGGNHMTDMQLAEALKEFFKGQYVGSFGDGPGRYKQLLLDSGNLKGYDAYDGAPFCETTSEGRVQFLDLTLPQYGLPVYDWIMSLEVAEHIPQKYESVYIDNVVRHARVGVVLSWARPGQGGYSHVNNRAFEYVKQLMESLGFSHDEVQSQKFKDASSFDWFKYNTNVFRRIKPLSLDVMRTLS